MGNTINPKSRKGKEQLGRIRELMGKMSPINEGMTTSELKLIKKGPNGVVYGIVKENHNYFIKTSEKKSGHFVAKDFDYIGGLENITDEKYKTYEESLKHLNIKMDMLNESFGGRGNVNIFESDGVAFAGGVGYGFVLEDEEEEEGEEIISDSDEEEMEEQKKVLKVDTPAPAAAPSQETPVEDEVSVEDDFTADMEGGDEFGGEEMDTEVDSEGDEDTVEKKVQKLTGKIGQMIRDMEEPDAELEKYVINSFISAMHLDEMPDEDIESIIAKLEGEEEEDEMAADEFGGEEEVEVDTEVEASEEPTAEIEETEEKAEEDEEEGEESEEESEEENLPESRVFTKEKLLESILKKSAKTTLKKVLKERREICEECLGEGCPTCMGEHHDMSYTDYGKFDRDEYMIDEEDIYEKLVGKQSRIDKNRNGKIDAEDFRMMRKKGRKRLGEDDLSVVDALATGQDYLEASGDLDRDGDDIPNRLDLDNNDDGRLDFGMGDKTYDWPEDILGKKGDRDGDGIPNRFDSDVDGDGLEDERFIDMDIDFIMSDPAPTVEPGIKEPTTKPGKGKPGWKKIKRPKVNPKPKAEKPKFSARRKGIYR
jgi:hypothetical protein